MIFSITQHINGYFPKKSLSRCCLLPAWEQGPAFGRFWKKKLSKAARVFRSAQ
jgi:hypothetical protein